MRLALRCFNGISTRYTGAKIRQITDGTSKTALVGEKALPPRFYETGYGERGTNYANNNGGDNSSMYQGYDIDNTRWIGAVPEQDSRRSRHTSFDSVSAAAHPGGMNMALCDGSVQYHRLRHRRQVWGMYGIARKSSRNGSANCRLNYSLADCV